MHHSVLTPTHPLVPFLLFLLSPVVRLLIWAFVGLPSLRQIYSFMTDPTCKRIGHQTFLSLVVLLTELIVIAKFGRDEFPDPMSDNVKLLVVAFLVVYGLILLVLALRMRTKTDDGEETDEDEQHIVEAKRTR